MRIAFLLLGVLLYQSQAIYEHQAGLHDWSLRQFGPLQEVVFGGNQIYFTSDIFVGAIDKSTGQVQYSQDFSRKLIKCQNQGEVLKFIYYDESQKTLFSYQQKDNLHKMIGKISLESEKLSFCLVQDETEYIVITDKRVLILDNEANIKSKQSFLQNQHPIQAQFLPFQQTTQPSLLVRQEKKVCVFQILFHNQLLEEKACESLSNTGNLEARLTEDQYIIWDENEAFELDFNKARSLYQYLPLLKTSQLFFTYSKSFISKVSGKVYLYDITDDEPQSIQEFTSSTAFAQIPSGKIQKRLFYYTRYEKGKTYFQAFDAVAMQDTNLGVVDVNTNQKPIKTFVRNYENNKRLFIVQHEDYFTYCYSTAEQTLLWQNEQALSSVAAVFWEHFSEEKSHKNSYFESLDKNGPKNPLYVVQNLILRFANDIQDLVEYSQSLPAQLIKFALDVKSLSFRGGNSGAAQRAASKAYDITYGLRQKIIIITNHKSILCFDSEDGELLWKDTSMVNRMESSFELKGHFKIELKIIHREIEDNALQLHHLLVYYSEEQQRLNLYILDAETGNLQQVASQKSSKLIHLQSYRVNHENPQYDNLVLLLNEDQEIITYPRVPLDMVGLGKDRQVVLYNYDSKTHQMLGFTFIQNQLVQTWNFQLGQEEQILKVRSSFNKDERDPKIALWDDKRVLFKLIDYSNFALLTRDTDTNVMNLYIINSQTGKVIYQSFQKNVEFSLPINLAFDENSIFVTYFNPSTSIYEIWTVEAYHSKIEVSFLSILDDYYFNKKEETHLNYYESELSAVFLQQVYGYPLGVKQLSVTHTLHSLTKKNLIIITPENQIYSLDRNLLSSRRRKNAQTVVPDDSFESVELPPYQYLIPIMFMETINYNRELSNMSRFHIQPTNLESTSLLLITGGDLFFTRISPDQVIICFSFIIYQTYDMIQTDFNYTLLLMTVVLIVVLTYFTRSLAIKTKIVKFLHSG